MSNLTRWEPFRDIVTLREAMDRLFEESFVGPFWGYRSADRDGTRAWRLPIDVYTTPEEIVVTAAVPGIKPDDVEITIEGDTVTLKGELPRPMENVSYIFQERPYGSFVRTLQLDVPIQADKAEAHFDNGLLTLTLPKAEAVKPRAIKVQASR
jgi:HSP20 family protein